MQNIIILAMFNERGNRTPLSAYNPYLYATENIQNHTDKLRLCICIDNTQKGHKNTESVKKAMFVFLYCKVAMVKLT